jgi:uncharacterized protein (UPF0335 family)
MAPKKKEGSNEAYATTADELRQFVEQIETLQADAKGIADDIKDKFAEAKGRGYDTKALRAIIAERKKNADEVQEFEAIIELYRAALGMGSHASSDGDEGSGADDDGMV